MQGAPERSHALTDSGMCNPRVWARKAILGNMIRQREEIRVREKCGGFMLVVQELSMAHCPSRACVPLGSYPRGTAENRQVVPTFVGGGSVNLRVQVT